MSACNQCLKVPCECMDDRADLLRGEFPGWSVARSPTGFWMWPGNGPMPRADERALVGAAQLPEWWTGCTLLDGQRDFPDLLTAAEFATGETRLSRRPKPETGTARVVSWAEDIREQYEAAKAKHTAFDWSDDINFLPGRVATIRARHDGMQDLVFRKVTDHPWRGSTLGIDVSATPLEAAFVAVMDACRRGDDNRPRPLAPSAEALRAKGAVELIVDDGSGDSIIPLYVAPGQMRWYATKDGDYVGDAFKTPLDALRAVDAVRPAAKSAGDVEERDFHKLSVILEKHVADLRAAFPDREWSFSVGRDLAASCIHENEFGNAPYPPSYIQWRNGWFAGTEDDPETKTYTTPVDAFRALLTQPQHAAPRQVRPAHYGGTNNPYECIKVIRAWGLNFELGNVAKYLSRAGKKPGVDAVDDLRKLITYAEMEIERREADRDN